MEQTPIITRPQRRRRTKAEIFKEAYLPYLILLCAAIVIVTFIIGAITRNNHQNDAAVQAAVSQTLEV